MIYVLYALVYFVIGLVIEAMYTQLKGEHDSDYHVGLSVVLWPVMLFALIFAYTMVVVGKLTRKLRARK